MESTEHPSRTLIRNLLYGSAHVLLVFHALLPSTGIYVALSVGFLGLGCSRKAGTDFSLGFLLWLGVKRILHMTVVLSLCQFMRQAFLKG